MGPEEEGIITTRLKNWGKFNRIRGGIPKLGFTSFTKLMSEYLPQDCFVHPDEIDAMYIGEIISSLDIAARRGDINWGDVYAYVLFHEFIKDLFCVFNITTTFFFKIGSLFSLLGTFLSFQVHSH